ncbi:primosomal protein N' [Actinocorallia sp. API 0066]|uniref:primosomal protein N' n=1 Tax=Actinocorallia sp. API 0066 TaxID=2896846 RepID=UPI0035AC1A38
MAAAGEGGLERESAGGGEGVVARVLVDVGLVHLDRVFDYVVPEGMGVGVGCRVRVRFRGKLRDGFVVGVGEGSGYEGRLVPLERVVSSEAVLVPEIAGLAREVADRYAGTLADVVRLAVPPRHARAEKRERGEAAPVPEAPDGPGHWAEYPAGPSYLAALAEGRSPRAVWTALPGPHWPGAIARAARAAASSGRGVVVVLADGRQADRVAAALTAEFDGASPHVVLRADDGPEKRYGRWLRALRGEARIVVGTRAAMFAPVHDLGLVVLWDDGDDVHAEPHAPYPHAREVLALRAHRSGAAVLFGGLTRTAETTRLVETGWAHPLTAPRETVRRFMPLVRPTGEDAELARDEAARTARLPALAFRTAREALADGPVLVQVPRRGYLPALACAQCREPARCPACAGPLALGSAGGAPACRWCGAIAGAWRCAECGGTRVRAVVVGAGRTAEELGRAFPGVTVRTSGRDAVLAEVGAEPCLVVATPGAEPVAAEGYAAALLLDGWAMLGRPDLRVNEEALRRWLTAAGLVRPQGRVVLAADAGLPVVQAVVRWDPVTFAERELAERRELRFPPAARMASLTGTPAAIRDLLDHARLPETAELLGPVPHGDPRHGETRERALLRVPRRDSTALARALKEAQSIRAARRAPDPVRIQLDPLELL